MLYETQGLIEDYIKEIDSGDFLTCYNDAWNSGDAAVDIIGDFTQTLLDADIDPLSDTRIDKIGYGMFYGTHVDEIVVPERITQIGEYAFSNSQLSKIIFRGNKLRNILSYAFYGTKLKEITLPEGCIEIDSEAFELCKELEQVTLPRSLEYMGYGVFSNCDKLRTVHYTGTMDSFNSLCENCEHWQAQTNIDTVVCSDGMLAIEDY